MLGRESVPGLRAQERAHTPPPAELPHPAICSGTREKVIAHHQVSVRRNCLRDIGDERFCVRRLDERLDPESEVHRRGKRVRAEIEFEDRGPSTKSLTCELCVNPAIGDAEAGHLRPAEYIFQARADAAAEVKYAPRAAFRDTAPQEIVHEVEGLLSAANALTPNRSMNDAVRAALSMGKKARCVLIVVSRYVGAFESHEAGATT